MTATKEPWLVIIDPQVIFADPDSEWCSPMWEHALGNIQALAKAFGERVVMTRWVPTADRSTSWGEYFAQWPFADVPANHALYELVPEMAAINVPHVIDEPTFGKWSEALVDIVGPAAHVVVAGVSTDCCVISTVLPAADAGAWITVATDACAGSSPENHAKALEIMGLFPPQVSLKTTASILNELAANA